LNTGVLATHADVILRPATPEAQQRHAPQAEGSVPDPRSQSGEARPDLPIMHRSHAPLPECVELARRAARGQIV